MEIIDISNISNIENKKDESLCQYKDCIKKIKITTIPCKCKKYYCKMHKYPEYHECIYDYKENILKSKKIEEMKSYNQKIQKII